MSQLLATLESKSYAQLRVIFSDAISRRDVPTARACHTWLCSSSAGGYAERLAQLLQISG